MNLPLVHSCTITRASSKKAQLGIHLCFFKPFSLSPSCGTKSTCISVARKTFSTWIACLVCPISLGLPRGWLRSKLFIHWAQEAFWGLGTFALLILRVGIPSSLASFHPSRSKCKFLCESVPPSSASSILIVKCLYTLEWVGDVLASLFDLKSPHC